MSKELFESESKALEDKVSKANAIEGQDYEDLDELKQGSKAWFKKRLGKFTGSKYPSLMKKGRGKEEWGQMAKNVILQVFIERDLSDVGIQLYVDELFAKNFRATDWGNKYESHAIEKYCTITENKVEPTTFQLHETFTNMGGSFDGRILEQNGIIEVKCPYDVLRHHENYELSIANEGISEKHDYYGQIQGNMFIGDADFCDFVSFDPRRSLLNTQVAIIRVSRDDDYITRLISRVAIAELAVEYMMEGIDLEGALLLAQNELK